MTPDTADAKRIIALAEQIRDTRANDQASRQAAAEIRELILANQEDDD